MPKRNVWNKLQAHTNIGIPKIVEQMLKTAGYIGKLSLGAIDKTALKEIESFYSKDVQLASKFLSKDGNDPNTKDYELMIDRINDQSEESGKFTLLPAHQLIASKIPDWLKEIEEIENEKRQQNVTSKASKGGIADQMERYIANAKAKTEQMSDDEVKENVIRIVKKALNKAAQTSVSKEQIQDLKLVNDKKHSIECMYQCPLCPVRVKCYFKKSWNVASVHRHFKTKCFAENLKQNEPNTR